MKNHFCQRVPLMLQLLVYAALKKFLGKDDKTSLSCTLIRRVAGIGVPVTINFSWSVNSISTREGGQICPLLVPQKLFTLHHPWYGWFEGKQQFFMELLERCTHFNNMRHKKLSFSLIHRTEITYLVHTMFDVSQQFLIMVEASGLWTSSI